MTILLFPQNHALEIFAQSMLLMLSFWFCVKPIKHLFSKFSSLSLSKIGFNSGMKTEGSSLLTLELQARLPFCRDWALSQEGTQCPS